MEVFDTAAAEPLSKDVFAELLRLVSRNDVFSDMIITADEPVMIRNAAGCFPIDVPPFSADDIGWILTQMEPDWDSLITAGGFSRPVNQRHAVKQKCRCK